MVHPNHRTRKPSTPAAKKRARKRYNAVNREKKHKVRLKKAGKKPLAIAAPLRSPTGPTDGQVAAIEEFFSMIPESELRAALRLVDDTRAMKLLTLMDDPEFEKRKMAMRLREAGFDSAVEVTQLIVSTYHMDASLRVARRIPVILEQMAEESVPHYIPCPKCNGSDDDDAPAEAIAEKMLGKQPVCGRCRGKRRILAPADNDVRKLVLDTQKLLDKGPLVDARSIHMYGSGRNGRDVDAAAPDMSDWSRASDRSLERELPRRQLTAPAVIDTEPITETPAIEATKEQS